ncbi:MAG: hypothetical protein Q3994_06645, partial [Prevotella sp.]|nr:hypothetical protein [Prevotella sp.]
MKTIKKLALMLFLLTISISGSAQSKNGQTYQDGDDWYLMLEDFNGATPTIGGWRFDKNKESGGDVAVTSGKFHYKFSAYSNDFSEYLYLDVTTLPQGKTLDSNTFTSISFYLYQSSGGDLKDKTVEVWAGAANSTADKGIQIGTFKTLNTRDGGEQMIEVTIPAEISKTGSFRLWIGGGIKTNSCYVEVDDIRLKYKEAPTPVGPSAPSITTDLNAEYAVNQGDVLA